VNLNYSHNERFVIGGAVPGGRSAARTDRTGLGRGPFAAGAPRMGIVNIGGPGFDHGRRQRFALGNKECLYVPMGSEEVIFEGEGARFYIASVPAHKALPIKHITLDQANPLARGDLANSNQRTIYQLVIPGVCESAQLLLGLTVLEEGSVWNTMPPHLHDRRSEIYLYFDCRPRPTACSTTWASPKTCATS
jgi:4-deoxy-L-threo-5-hexosulose-uronate ketol-isomerase